MPEEARWDYIAKHSNKPEIVQIIDKAMVAIERENNRLNGIESKRKLCGWDKKYLLKVRDVGESII